MEKFPVIIAGYAELVNADGESFTQLILEQDELRARQSDKTLYMGTKTCRITSSWSKAKCELFVGKPLPAQNANIVQVDCDEYTWTNPSTGEEEKRTKTWKLQVA